MKKHWIVFTGVVVSLVFMLPLRGWSVVVPETADQHLALAQSYEDRAAKERQTVAEHEKMKVDYREQVAVSPKSESLLVKKMDKHCDAIIATAKELEREFEKFAEWHRMRASELEGK